MPRGDSQHCTTGSITTMTLPADDRDDLIKELFTEAHGLRMKNEQISQYVETKISELVKTRRELLQTRGGLEVLVEQRNKLQGQLDAVTTGYEQLNAMHANMTDQRDRLRIRIVAMEELVEKGNKLQGQLDAITTENGQLVEMRGLVTGQRDSLQKRVEEVEASRSYRIGQRLSRIAAKFSQQK